MRLHRTIARRDDQPLGGRAPPPISVTDYEGALGTTIGLVMALSFIADAMPSDEKFLRFGPAHHASCLIGDVKMPEMTGFTFISNWSVPGRRSPPWTETSHEARSNGAKPAYDEADMLATELDERRIEAIKDRLQNDPRRVKLNPTLVRSDEHGRETRVARAVARRSPNGDVHARARNVDELGEIGEIVGLALALGVLPMLGSLEHRMPAEDETLKDRVENCVEHAITSGDAKDRRRKAAKLAQVGGRFTS